MTMAAVSGSSPSNRDRIDGGSSGHTNGGSSGRRRVAETLARKHWDNNDSNNQQRSLRPGLGIALLSTIATGTMTKITLTTFTTTTIMPITSGRGTARQSPQRQQSRQRWQRCRQWQQQDQTTIDKKQQKRWWQQ
jgi:hypothetical protein